MFSNALDDEIQNAKDNIREILKGRKKRQKESEKDNGDLYKAIATETISDYRDA